MERANVGYAKGGSYKRHSRGVFAAKKAGKAFAVILAVAAFALSIVVLLFSVRAIIAKLKDKTPERITIRYSEEISESMKREDAYKEDVLFVNFDTVAEILGLSKSQNGNAVTYYTKSGDSMTFEVGRKTVEVNKIPCPAVGTPFFNDEGELMAAAELINLYVNETSVTVSGDKKTATLVSLAESITFNLKKSETLGGMDKPTSFPSNTKYDPNGTLPNAPETTERVTEESTTVETTVDATTTEATTPVTTAPPEPTVEDIIAAYEFKSDISKYKEYLNPKNKDEYLILANRKYPVGETHVPQDLVHVKDKYVIGTKEYLLRNTAAMALEAMIEEMKACRVWDTFVCSTYRSYEYQVSLYQRYFNQEKAANPGLSDDEIRAIVDTYSSRPGTSDHHTGLCVDFYDVEMSFMDKAAYKWLTENAYKFGFIIRFPEGKTDITGYMFEPWHWRFVGQESAYEIYSRNITLEEYLGKAN